MEKKQTGSLLTRNVGDLVKKVSSYKRFSVFMIYSCILSLLPKILVITCFLLQEHFVLDSEYLTTLLVVVPLATMNDWHSKYEQLTDMVVPRFDSKDTYVYFFLTNNVFSTL